MQKSSKVVSKPSLRHRTIAIFFTIIFLQTLVPNNQLWASEGPTSPEAASFEPIDAVDMVDLLTGDFSYSLPIIEVPSPEGGYPLALSYHAGIATDLEASWAGLGWNINPGAINRNVMGSPDDWKRAETYNISYNKGGVSTNYGVSLNVGWHDGLFSAGLYANYSENKTFGGETSKSFDVGVKAKGVGAEITAGTDGFGIGISRNLISHIIPESGIGGTGITPSLNASVGYHTKRGFSGNITLGVSKAFPSILKSSISLGLDFSSDGANSSIGGSLLGFGIARVGGKSSVGKTSSISSSFNVAIPIGPAGINFSYNKQRYWFFDTEVTKNNGALYANDMDEWINESAFHFQPTYDVYEKIEGEDLDLGKLNSAFTFPAYDDYSVTAQGISGAIKPHLLETGILKGARSKVQNKYISYLYPKNAAPLFTKGIDNNDKLTNKGLHFYFENEHASFLKIDSDKWDVNSALPASGDITNLKPSDYRFDSELVKGTETYNGYNATNGRKRTGSYVESYTNKQLRTSNLIITPSNFNRHNAELPEDGIGGFKITAVDGKTYHYAIPVYQKEKSNKITKIDKEFENEFFQIQDIAPYATHWLLTAITGPDYVDRNSNNRVDGNDFGYWVEFDYGKWSDGYVWRTPYEGSKLSEDSKFFQWGIKEIYYLDAIKTRTHTALFVKEAREDNLAYNLNLDPEPYTIPINKSYISGDDGKIYFDGLYDRLRYNTTIGVTMDSEYKLKYTAKSNAHKLLKLNKIILLKNTDLADGSYKDTNQQVTSNFKGQLFIREDAIAKGLVSQIEYYREYKILADKTWEGEFYKNVVDTKDITKTIIEKSISSVDFKHDYALATASPNSIANGSGRLTLKRVSKNGKHGISLMPPYAFKYYNEGGYNKDKEDNWGYYENAPHNWSLKQVQFPEGGKLNIEYEPDDIHKEAISDVRRVFKSGLEFKVWKYDSGIHRLDITNKPGNPNPIDFTNHFTYGEPVRASSLWFCFQTQYKAGLNCIYDTAVIDLSNRNIYISSLTKDKIELTEREDYPWYVDDNGDGDFGFKYLQGKAISYGTELLGVPGNNPISSKHPKKNCLQWDNPCRERSMMHLYYNIKSNKDVALENSGKSGVRVKSLTLDDNQGNEYQTEYFYNQPGSSSNPEDAAYVSSGTTSYIPRKYSADIADITEIPSPSVMYEYVTKSKGIGESKVRQQYYFEVFKEVNNSYAKYNTLAVTKVQDQNSSSQSNIRLSKYDILNKESAIGRLNALTTYNSKNQIVSKQMNTYSGGEIKQGRLKETFYSYRRIEDGDNVSYNLNVSSKQKVPSILKSTIKIENGIKTTIKYKDHDFLTGQVLETEMEMADGTLLKNNTTPAYEEYSSMGGKVENSSFKNMLTQKTASYSYIKLDADGWKPIAANVNTWSQSKHINQDVWRKKSNYVWNGELNKNGTFKDFENFKWKPNENIPDGWRKISEITRYDQYSKPLERIDINGHEISSRYGDNDTKIIAVANAGYENMFYSGVEYLKGSAYVSGGGVSIGRDSEISSKKSHTGKKSLKVIADKVGFTVRPNAIKNYRASVWADKNNYMNTRLKIDNALKKYNDNELVFAGDWVQLNFYFSVDTTYEQVYVTTTAGTVYLDDFRVHPVESSMTSYVYNEWDELSTVLGPNNLGTKYVYDAMGRLKGTQVEYSDEGESSGGFKPLKTFYYNYRHKK